jgi:hypothetical protein
VATLNAYLHFGLAAPKRTELLQQDMLQQDLLQQEKGDLFAKQDVEKK